MAYNNTNPQHARFMEEYKSHVVAQGIANPHSVIGVKPSTVTQAEDQRVSYPQMYIGQTTYMLGLQRNPLRNQVEEGGHPSPTILSPLP